ncbi:MAG: AAA family ATPase [Candidatus Aegiribacteria sp.]|nr:AAA family ATPase [Candidatus Aegiribacteria sp.]
MATAVIEQIVTEGLNLHPPSMIRRELKLPAVPDLATVILGMRRTGKTWFMYQAIGDLLDEGIPRERILYINFEDDRLGELDHRQMRLIEEEYFRRFPELRNELVWFFLDEVQEVGGWESYTRTLLDRRGPRLILSGSSSRLLSGEVATQMRGRSLTLEVKPFSFREYLKWRGLSPERYPEGSTRPLMEKSFLEYLDTGGFPAVLPLEDMFHRQLLQNYVNTVIFRDVIDRWGVTNITLLKYVVRRLLVSCSCRTSVNRIFKEARSQGLHCSKNTVYDYLGYLEDAYMVESMFIETASERRRMTNPRKVYAIDPGLVNAFVGQSGGWGLGRALEDAVFVELRRRGRTPSYVMLKDGFEIDFSFRDEAGEQILMQVCSKLDEQNVLERETRALAADPRKVRRQIITLHEERNITRDGLEIEILPAWKWFINI